MWQKCLKCTGLSPWGWRAGQNDWQALPASYQGKIPDGAKDKVNRRPRKFHILHQRNIRARSENKLVDEKNNDAVKHLLDNLSTRFECFSVLPQQSLFKMEVEINLQRERFFQLGSDFWRFRVGGRGGVAVINWKKNHNYNHYERTTVLLTTVQQH